MATLCWPRLGDWARVAHPYPLMDRWWGDGATDSYQTYCLVMQGSVLQLYLMIYSCHIWACRLWHDDLICWKMRYYDMHPLVMSWCFWSDKYCVNYAVCDNASFFKGDWCRRTFAYSFSCQYVPTVPCIFRLSSTLNIIMSMKNMPLQRNSHYASAELLSCLTWTPIMPQQNSHHTSAELPSCLTWTLYEEQCRILLPVTIVSKRSLPWS